MGTANIMHGELASIVGPGFVGAVDDERRLQDATEVQRLPARADVVVRPGTAGEVAEVMAWCYRHEVPLTPRGGGTGLAGGAVPLEGGVLLALDRLTGVRALDPQWWRMHVEAGLRTSHVQRLARENGLAFPPDPGAAEQSQIGGNVATNAGGPHAFKYGVMRHWVTGLEVVLPPGRVVTLGGPYRKDVAGLDLLGLVVGSEGTLGVVTAAWLRLIPAPAAALPVAAAYADSAAGAQAIEHVLASGLVPSAIEYLEGTAVTASRAAFPTPLNGRARFVVLVDCDGDPDEARRARAEIADALADGALSLHAPDSARDVDALWRWRSGVPLSVAGERGGKVSEDVAVPLDRLREAIERTVEIGRRHDLEACSWGHAGDGNLHSTFLVDPRAPHELTRAHAAADELFELALELGGSITGEHGVGSLKRGYVPRQFDGGTLDVQRAIKHTFDPKGLLNPGKKL